MLLLRVILPVQHFVVFIINNGCDNNTFSLVQLCQTGTSALSIASIMINLKAGFRGNMVTRKNYENVIAFRVDLNMAVVFSANMPKMRCFKTIFGAFVLDSGNCQRVVGAVFAFFDIFVFDEKLQIR